MSKYRKSLSKENVITPSQVIFQGKSLLTGRPDSMPYNDYRELRGVQNKVLQKLHPFAPNPKIASQMREKVKLIRR